MSPHSRFGQIQSSRPPGFQDSRVQESRTSGSRSPGLPYPELLGCRAPGNQGFRIPGSRPSRLHVSTAPCLRGSRTSGRQAKTKNEVGNSEFRFRSSEKKNHHVSTFRILTIQSFRITRLYGPMLPSFATPRGSRTPQRDLTNSKS